MIYDALAEKVAAATMIVFKPTAAYQDAVFAEGAAVARDTRKQSSVLEVADPDHPDYDPMRERWPRGRVLDRAVIRQGAVLVCALRTHNEYGVSEHLVTIDRAYLPLFVAGEVVADAMDRIVRVCWEPLRESPVNFQTVYTAEDLADWLPFLIAAEIGSFLFLDAAGLELPEPVSP